MEEIKNKIENFKKNHSFKLGKKDIIIIVLAFLFILACSDANDSSEYENQISELNTQITNLNTELESAKKQVTDLQETNKSLEEKNQELTSKINETESSSISTEQTSSENSGNSTTTTSPETSNSSNNTSNSENSQMVWVGDSGTKYHNEGCRTLKGNGHQITLQQALAEGREPCKVCH